jgi:hypothetical protein
MKSLKLTVSLALKLLLNLTDVDLTNGTGQNTFE